MDSSGHRGRSRARVAVVGVTAASISICLVVLAVLSNGANERLEASASPTRTQTSRVVAPNVTGLPLIQAVAVLGTLGLRIDEENLRALVIDSDRGTVFGKEVWRGSRIDAGQAVDLVLSAGLHAYPHAIPKRGRLIVVGGSCDLMWPSNAQACAGGQLMVPLVSA
jgi:hypothetical protein